MESAIRASFYPKIANFVRFVRENRYFYLYFCFPLVIRLKIVPKPHIFR